MPELKEIKKEHKQQDLSLKNTRAVANMFTTARAKEMFEVANELFKIIQIFARIEWGQDTTVDDFSIPGKFVIRSGKKEEEI